MEDFFKWIVAGFAGGAGIWLLIKSYIDKYAGAFLEEKGKNLATKQDIGDIAKIVESIKHENNLILEEVKGKHQMRLASIDKRLAVHQEAYTLWRDLLQSVHQKDKCGDMVIKCQEWWYKNCLYLDQNARQAFYEAYHAAFHYPDLWASREDRSVLDEYWAKITNAGKAIEEGTALPSIHIPEQDMPESEKGGQ
ncbi:MAG: hypothetical protein PHU44_03935 [Syntrophales bacterium]|nr:hypothetical protein [Syntrophales bacterium]MDD5640569.1 hypothetical protein [Syntrophales bacterium]